MEVQNESVLKKPKRLTSIVWNHFERIRKADICYAVCVHCSKKLSGSSNSGTTHLRNHLMRCLKRSNYDVSQLLAKRKRRETGGNPAGAMALCYDEGGERKDSTILNSSIVRFEQEPPISEHATNARFNQERSSADLSRMIIMHGYPLSMADHAGFRTFVKNLQPLFDLKPVHRSTEQVCMEIYEKEKQRTFETIKKHNGGINLSIDVWTSDRADEYLSLKANFIDADWRLRRKTLNFITLHASHTEDMLADIVLKCASEWDIDRCLFSITSDGCFTNPDVVAGIAAVTGRAPPGVFDVGCAAAMLRSIVSDAIESVACTSEKIRRIIRHVRSSQSVFVKFNDVARQSGTSPSERPLVIDCPTRWQSTYAMLDTALHYRQPLAACGGPSEEEWDWVGLVSTYLKLLVEICAGFSVPATANAFFPEMCDVRIRLHEWCGSGDARMSAMAARMKDRFDAYWRRCGTAMTVAAILDPRFKLKVVEYYYPQIFGSDAGNDRVQDACDAVREMFAAYVAGCSSSAVAVDEDADGGGGGGGVMWTAAAEDRLKGFDRFLHETSQTQGSTASDLDKYLDEPVFPRNYDFNILNWWRVHTPRYPVLSMMARDVLGMPMATVSLDSIFCVGRRVLDSDRARLTPDTRQALVCAQDWLHVELDTGSIPL